MKKIVKSLIGLQEIDQRLNDLKMQKGDLPSMIGNMNGDLDDKKSLSEELAEKSEKLRNDRKIFEKEIEASKIQLKKYEEQLYLVQNNKEYDAISLEIDTKKVEIENLESKIIQTLEDEEDITGQIGELNEAVEGLNSDLDDKREELAEIDQTTQDEEKRLKKERDKIAAEIDERYLRRYERIRAAKDGLAVVSVRRGSCNGCFSSIPSQRIVEIKVSDRLMTCEYCGRILVWDDEESGL